MLLVADREDGAVLEPRARAGEKLGAERGENAPLWLGRVLRFVEQQMIEPVVELVQHPGGARPRHQRERPRNLIVEIERAPLGFHPRECGQDRSCDHEQGGAPLQGQRGASSLAQDEQAVLLATQIVLERRDSPGHVFACNRAILPAARLAVVLEKCVEECADAIFLRVFEICRAKVRANFLVVPPAGFEAFSPLFAARPPDVPAKHLRLDARDRHAGRKTEGSAQRGCVGERVVMRGERLGAAERLHQKLIESGRARLARNQVQRAHAFARSAEHGERRVARLAQEPLRFAFIENVEVSGHVRLERKEPEQSFGEGVQRLDLEAAGGLDRAREQLPREDEVMRSRRGRSAVDDGLRQGLVVEARPLREFGENAVGHVCGRRLGVGETEDLRRRSSIEQEPQHALGEDMGLAAAGVGGHPGRVSRV